MEVELGPTALSLLAGTIIPLLVGFVTKQRASRRLKLITNAVLSALAGIVAVAIEAKGVLVIPDSLYAALGTFATSMATYHLVLKPSGIAGVVSGIAPNVGIGGGIDWSMHYERDDWSIPARDWDSYEIDADPLFTRAELEAMTRKLLDPMAEQLDIPFRKFTKPALIDHILDEQTK